MREASKCGGAGLLAQSREGNTVDPNEVLKALRRAYSDYEDVRGRFGGGPVTDASSVRMAAVADAADRLRDAAVALDEWLSRGGFLPAAWTARSGPPEACGECGAGPGRRCLVPGCQGEWV